MRKSSGNCWMVWCTVASISSRNIARSGDSMSFRAWSPSKNSASSAVTSLSESTIAAEIAERTVCLDEGFLRYVLGFLGVVHEPHDQSQYLVLVFQYQQIESPLVSALYPFNQLLILFLG